MSYRRYKQYEKEINESYNKDKSKWWNAKNIIKQHNIDTTPDSFRKVFKYIGKNNRVDVNCNSTLNIKDLNNSNLVITACVNNTKINKAFFDTLKLFCKYNNAKLIILPIYYKNPSAVNNNKEVIWDKSIEPYVLNQDYIVNKNLLISSAKLQATAVNPLSGMETIGGQRSVIFGHPQVSLKMIATEKNSIPKMITTTGVISSNSFSDTKAGKKGETFHDFAATFIKVDGNKFWKTELMWDGKTIHYLDEIYSVDEVKNSNIEALVIGDSHIAHEDTKLTEEREIVKEKLKPESLVWHDILDFYAQSHHHTLFDKLKVFTKDKHKVQQEIKECIEHLVDYGRGYKNYIVESNHDLHLDRWLQETDIKKDLNNFRFWVWLMNEKVNKDYNANKTALQICFDSNFITNSIDYEFLNPNDTKEIKGIVISQHGDKGPNGSRGSTKNIARTQRPSIKGHSHTPEIEKYCWSVGTSTMDMDYAKGLSSWMKADIIIYKNGKRGFLFYIDNKSII